VACRYLIHYSGWQRLLDDDKRSIAPAQLLHAIIQLGKRTSRLLD